MRHYALTGHRMSGGRFMDGTEHMGTGGAYRGMSPNTFINGKIKSVNYPTPASARNQPTKYMNYGGPLSRMGSYAEGGEVITPPTTQPSTNTNIPEGGYAQTNIGLYTNPYRASVYGGPLSYNQDIGIQQNKDYHTIKDSRKNFRDSLVGDYDQNQAALNAADALQRQTNDNAFGYNDRQTKALESAWSSSPDRVALEAENAQRVKEGKPPIQSTYGLNRYHVNPDGSRDYNYSADGIYRGDVPEEFATGNPNNPYDAHFNSETGKWEAGDLSPWETVKDIGTGLYDAYGNIKSTIPLIGQEVISGVKDLAGKFTGSTSTDSTESVAAAKAAADAKIRADSIAAANAAYAAQQASRNKQSAGSKALADSTRAQLQKSANNYTSSQVSNYKKTGKVVGGFNMGGPVGYMQAGGGIAQSMVNDDEERRQAQMQEAQMLQAQQGPLSGVTDQLKNKVIGNAASMATKAIFSGATGGTGGFLAGLFAQDGGYVNSPSYMQSGGQINPIDKIVKALRKQKISPEQAAQALQQVGVPQEQIGSIIVNSGAMNEPQISVQGPLASQQQQQRPEELIAQEVAGQLGNQGGPDLPAQQFNSGGMVHSKMMSMGSGPLSSLKVKNVNGHNSEEMALGFDTKAAA